ncbi:TRAP transporter small permease subunit [Prochlorococcus sp. MIT 1341]|uniref:TRAP transporter small permease subunit n=1 Tax=Prochlorococcus sp. MIT 1341 TaxID=3096221 RepID=UPI002A753873|nr:TRAP transporter small permease subunit [Prochlorococcus sp. MIT 1341]
MKGWLVLSNRLETLVKLLAVISRWAVLMMLAVGFWNVVGRYVGAAIGYNLSSNRLIEGQWYLFDLFFLLGLSWTLQRKGHVRVDVLQTSWSPRQKRRMDLVGICFLLIPFAVLVIVLSIQPALHSWSIGELSPDPNGLPRYWVKSLVPLGFFLLLLQGLAELIKSLVFLRDSSIFLKFYGLKNEEDSLG